MDFLQTSQCSKFLEKYLQKVKPGSRRVYKSILTNFFEFYQGDLDKISANTLEQYKEVLASKNSPATVKRNFSILNSFFKALSKSKDWGEFKNPIVHLKDYETGSYVESPAFKKLLASFLAELDHEKTRQAYRLHIQSFFKFINKSSREITTEDIRIYRDQLIEQNLKPNTLWLKFVSLNRFFKFIKIDNPIDFQKLKLPAKRRRTEHYAFLSPDEVKKILSQPNRRQLIEKRNYAMLMIMCIFGLRVNEIAKLHFGDLKERVEGQLPLIIRDRKGRVGNRPDTQLILNGRVLHALDDWLTASRIRFTNTTPVFLGFRWDRQEQDFVIDHARLSKPLTTRAIEGWFEHYISKAGIYRDGTTVSCHALRHTAISILAQSGKVRLEQLREMAGHTDIRTTQLYVHDAQSFKNNPAMHSPFN